MKTEDEFISSFFLQKEGGRYFEAPLNFISKPSALTLDENLFGDFFKAPKVYITKVDKALVSPRPLGFPRYWTIFGKNHYVWQAVSETAKKALHEQGVINYYEDGGVSPNPVDVEFYDMDCVWFFSFGNYNHMLQETLPTILAIKDAGLDLNNYAYLVGDEAAYDDILQCFGIRRENIIHNKNGWLSCRSLLYPCFQSFGHLYTPTNYLDRLAVLFQSEEFVNGDAGVPKRLYVSRKNAAVRRILNEEDLVARLKDFGFYSVDPGDYSKIEQIALFSEAELIVGPHGMGMNNIFFSKNLHQVVEIFTSSWLRPAYWRMSQSRGVDYGAYILDPVNDNQDVIVDVDLICDYLKRAG